MRSPLRTAIAIGTVIGTILILNRIGWLVTMHWSDQYWGLSGLGREAMRCVMGLIAIMVASIVVFVFVAPTILVSEADWVHRIEMRIKNLFKRKPKGVPLSDLTNSSKYEKERAGKFM